MDIATAQRDVRTVFMGGCAGQLVSSALWFASAAAMTWSTFRMAVCVLLLGGMFIFPLTQLLLRAMRRPSSLPKHHPMNALAIQIAFIVPFSIPVILAVTVYRHSWFYPAVMIVIGTHYMPFIFLYGMGQFGVLAALLFGSGVFIAMYLPTALTLGGWITAALLLIFAIIGRQLTRSNQSA